MSEHHGPARGARDAVYAEAREQIAAFRFDAAVAEVFADMIARSVPGYALTLQLIAVAARRFALPGSSCYDLGCSLGASTLAIRQNAPPDCRVIGVDNSPDMVARCRAIVATDARDDPLEVHAIPWGSVIGNDFVADDQTGYGIGLLDTGASALVIGHTPAEQMNLFSSGMITTNTQTISGVTGSVVANVSMRRFMFQE